MIFGEYYFNLPNPAVYLQKATGIISSCYPYLYKEELENINDSCQGVKTNDLLITSNDGIGITAEIFFFKLKVKWKKMDLENRDTPNV